MLSLFFVTCALTCLTLTSSSTPNQLSCFHTASHVFGSLPEVFSFPFINVLLPSPINVEMQTLISMRATVLGNCLFFWHDYPSFHVALCVSSLPCIMLCEKQMEHRCGGFGNTDSTESSLTRVRNKQQGSAALGWRLPWQFIDILLLSCCSSVLAPLPRTRQPLCLSLIEVVALDVCADSAPGTNWNEAMVRGILPPVVRHPRTMPTRIPPDRARLQTRIRLDCCTNPQLPSAPPPERATQR